MQGWIAFFHTRLGQLINYTVVTSAAQCILNLSLKLLKWFNYNVNFSHCRNILPVCHTNSPLVTEFFFPHWYRKTIRPSNDFILLWSEPLQLYAAFTNCQIPSCTINQYVKRKASSSLWELKEASQASTLPLRHCHFYFSFAWTSIYVGKGLLVRLAKVRRDWTNIDRKTLLLKCSLFFPHTQVAKTSLKNFYFYSATPCYFTIVASVTERVPDRFGKKREYWIW